MVDSGASEDYAGAGVSLKIAGYQIEIIQTQDRIVKVARIFPAQPDRQDGSRITLRFTIDAKLGMMPINIK